MQVSNVKIVTPHEVLLDGELTFTNGIITGVKGQPWTESSKGESGKLAGDVSSSVWQSLPADEGDWLIPGLIDTHVHGAGGADLMDGEPKALARIARTLLELGTTAFLATSMTATDEELERALNAADQLITRQSSGRAYREKELSPGAECLGVHMEGPFIAHEFAGAQKRELIQPARAGRVRQYALWSGQNLRLFTMAPEMPGAVPVMEECLDSGILVSAGHSGASWAEACRHHRYIRHVTHAFNAMRPWHHREPGLAGWALGEGDVYMEVIADGMHVHPAVLRLAYRLKGPDKLILVSDGTRAVALDDGEYELGGQCIFVRDEVARLADGTLAGSKISLLQAVRNMLFQIGIPPADSVAMASITPARLLGLEQRLGSLEVGKEATFLRLDSRWTLKEVWLRGQKVINCGHS